jgi:hypothetical protein
VPERLKSRLSNTRIGNVCIAAGGAGGGVILKSCSLKEAGAKLVDGRIVFSDTVYPDTVAEVTQGVNIVPWVIGRPASDSAAQKWTEELVDGYLRLKTVDGQCLTVHDPPLPGPARVSVAPCKVPNVNQDFSRV